MFTPFRNLLITFIGFVLFLFLCSTVFRPPIGEEEVAFSEDEVSRIEERRAVNYKPEDRIQINLEVDYEEGEAGGWYPRGESPLLRELVEEKHLPPLEERIGPEPVVMRGVDGVGKYGGTIIKARNSKRNVGTFGSFYSGTQLVRWSPLGDPIVPHVAKRFEIMDGGRTFIFHLRRGIHWSDGHLFTAEDILYWWKHEMLDANVSVPPQNPMQHRGKTGTVEKVDDYTVIFRFEDPNSLFLGKLAGPPGIGVAGSPAHYLRQYHPTLGDPERIDQMMEEKQMPSRRALYDSMKVWDNPEHPRLWPYLYRSYRGNPPYSWVRNPYYFAVDPEGNQLPYVDRVLFLLKSADLIPIAAANGELSLQGGMTMEHYTILMTQREKGNYEVQYQSFGDGSTGAIFPNMTKRRTPSQPDAAKKEALMREKAFRQALSLAINREAIIEVEYGGITEAAQVGPGPASPYFNSDLYYSHVEYDVDQANSLLDGIGLTKRDAEGYRTFPDESPMLFHLTFPSGSSFTGAMAQSIVEDWAAVGIRMVFKARGTNLYYIEREGMLHDFTVAGVNGEAYSVLRPRMYVPSFGSFYAHAWGYWNHRGGFYGVDIPEGKGAIPPPEDHPLMKAIEIYDEVIQTTDPARQVEQFQKILSIAAENVWTINISSPPPQLVVVKNGLKNVAEKGYKSWTFLSPSNMGFETYYWEDPVDSAGAVEQIKSSIIGPLGSPQLSSGLSTGPPRISDAVAERNWRWLKYCFYGASLAALMVAGLLYPYIGRRLLLMIPTLFVVSILVFSIIQLPPGDYSTSLIAQAEAMGEEADLQRIEEIQELFMLEDSWIARYLSWSGLQWFFTWKAEDKGLLQGDLGRSMETLEPVNEIMGDRFMLTVFIGLATVLFTWVVALPIGIFSAVKQYSLLDYVFTVIGFLGMCVPNFLLALLLMYFSSTYLGLNVSGLFSAEYAAQPEWSFGKFMDLLAHLWVPVVVIGTGGTASMIRVMRGNLLDELKKPYVTTARAKGVRPFKLILKYPVRLALNPFISGIGHLFPQLISGGAIVALILSLPTVGPLLLSSLLMEDMYLAGSLLMVLSLLGILGTLVSDLLLMVLDPRIRMEGGRR